MLNSYPSFPSNHIIQVGGSSTQYKGFETTTLGSFSKWALAHRETLVWLPLILVKAWCQNKSWTRVPSMLLWLWGRTLLSAEDRENTRQWFHIVKYFTLGGKYWCTVLPPSLSIICALCHWEPIPSHWLVQLFVWLLSGWQWKPDLGSETGRGWWFGFCQVIFKLGEFLYHSYRTATSAFVLTELREWCILGLPPRICLMKPQHVLGGKGLPTQN